MGLCRPRESEVCCARRHKCATSNQLSLLLCAVFCCRLDNKGCILFRRTKTGPQKMVLGLMNLVITVMRQDYNIIQTTEDAEKAAKRTDKSVRARARLARKGRLSAPMFAMELHGALAEWLWEEQAKEDERSGRVVGLQSKPSAFRTPNAARAMMQQRGRSSRSSSPLPVALLPSPRASPTPQEPLRWRGSHAKSKVIRDNTIAKSGLREGKKESRPRKQLFCYLCKMGWCDKSGKSAGRNPKFCNGGQRSRRAHYYCLHAACMVDGVPVALCTSSHNGCDCWTRWHKQGLVIPGLDTCIAVDDA